MSQQPQPFVAENSVTRVWRRCDGRRWLNLAIRVALVITCLITIVMSPFIFPSVEMAIAVLIVATAIGSVVYGYGRAMLSYQTALTRIESAGPTDVPFLIEWFAASTSPTGNWSGIRCALIRLLPTMSSDDVVLLKRRQWLKLYAQLNSSVALCEPNVVVAILKAIELHGDGEAIPFVADLTDERIMEPVRGVAQRCLPFLIARDEAARAAGTLLRPAESSAQQLLRPAFDKQNAPDANLLRPVNSDSVNR